MSIYHRKNVYTDWVLHHQCYLNSFPKLMGFNNRHDMKYITANFTLLDNASASDSNPSSIF